MSDRIKLAEAVGWKPRPPSETQYEVYTWSSPYWKNGKRIVENSDCGESFCFEWQLPDPFTDANDCEALIVFLNEQGWEIEIDFNIGAQGVVMWREDKSLDCYAGDDWKHGVCELALKVLGESDE